MQWLHMLLKKLRNVAVQMCSSCSSLHTCNINNYIPRCELEDSCNISIAPLPCNTSFYIYTLFKVTCILLHSIKQRTHSNRHKVTFCDVKHMEFIAPSTPISEVSIPGKYCSRLSGTSGNATATKHSQFVLKEGDHSTPNLSHWSISLVQRLQFPPFQCGGVQSVKGIVVTRAAIISTKPVQ